jgi:hypothetical protein
MRHGFGFGQRLAASMFRPRQTKSAFEIGGRFFVEQFRNGILIAKEDIHNIVTNQGLSYALASCFDSDYSGTVPAAYNYWWIGLMNNDGNGIAGDTYASHSGWTEFTLYSGNRKNWLAAGDHESSQSISNAATVDFTISGVTPPDYVRGIILVSDGTDGSGTDIEVPADAAASDAILWATAEFAADLSVQDSDVIKVTYTVTASTS